MLRVRNYSYAPFLEREGQQLCPMPTPPPKVDPNGEWYSHLNHYERLFYHQTLASTRRSKRFIPTSKIPKDALDYRLQSRYSHSRDSFPEHVDFVLQTETCCEMPMTFRVLRNTRDVKLETFVGHPLKIGGITEKMSKHSVKLITSGPHDQLVNRGFSRQTGDGNFFRY